MRFRILLFALSLQLTFSGMAQDMRRESLKKNTVAVLKAMAETRKKQAVDTTLVNIYSVISAKLLYVNNAEAKQFAQKVLQLSQKLDYQRGMASGKNDLALVELAEGNGNKAYQLLHSNLAYYSGVHDDVGLGTNYLNIGIVHGSQNDLAKAIECFNQALVHYKKGNAKNSLLASAYSMLGNAYSYQNNEAKSITNYRKALQLQDDPEDIINLQNNLGKAYAEFKQYDSALYYYKNVIVLNQKVKSTFNEMNSNLNIGDLHLKMQQPQLAISYLKEGLRIAQSEKHLEIQTQLQQLLSRAYQKTGDLNNAFKALQQYTVLKDSLQSLSSREAVKKIEAQFELERQDAKLNLLENQKQLNEAKLKKSNLMLLMGAIVVLLTLALAWYWYRQHKTKTLLNQQQEIQFKTALQLKEAESNLEGQLMERRRLAQELHDGLGATMAGIKLSALAHFSGQQDKNSPLIASLDDAYNEVRRMSHNLMPPEFSQASFHHVIEELLRKYEGQTATSLQLYCSEGNDLDRLDTHQKSQLYRILQEIINNTLKHAQCSSLSILITSFGDYINIIAEDNGIGFDPTKKAEGIGLQNIRERVKALHSELVIDSSPGNGTIVQFNIPFAT
ncbi:tetratricopeptide repeat-containing sensor histidine kinase [Flavobacterium sp. GCM10027622]|uniref:tetratricopeptide repeat-containing sensor histidine kinase n=1 Tax=unclassified Flavobacterium TaxID=196869 RepID=UPI003615BADA